MCRSNLSAILQFSRLLLTVSLLFTTAIGQQDDPDPDEVRISTDLFQASVVILDKNDRPVEGLKPEQFELKVDGKVRPIEFFEANSTGQIVSGADGTETPQANINSKAILSERKIIFFLDDLHLAPDSLNRTRSAIKKFTDDNMLPLDQILVVTSSGRLGFLQQFTDNPAVVNAIAERIQPFPDLTRDTDQPPMPEYLAIQILNGNSNVTDYYVEKFIESIKIKSSSVNREAVRRTVIQRANSIVKSLTVVSQSTLESVRSMVDSLRGMRGRKLVFLFSDGFFLTDKGNGNLDNRFLQRLAGQAAKDDFTFYTIDARGMSNSIAVDATGSRPNDPNGRLEVGRLGEDSALQEGLFEIADGTGGVFLGGTNYFDKWIDRVLTETSVYYTLAWLPEEDEQTAQKFKKIEVSVIGRPNLKVRLQNGFLTGKEKPGDAKSEKKQTEKNAEVFTSDERKIPQNLPVSVSVNYLDVPGQNAMITSSVQIKTGKLDYGANGKTVAHVDLAGIVLNEKGKQVADFKTGLDIDSASGSEQNIIYNARTPLEPGIYLVKIAAREQKTGKLGGGFKWIFVPDLSKRKITLSSLFLDSQEVTGKDGKNQVQFSVDHRFGRPLQFNFVAFIYNSSKPEKDKPNLTAHIEVFDARGKKIINSPVRRLEVQSVADISHIPLKGAIKQDAATAGKYLLRVTVNDLNSGDTAVREAVFSVG
ncbi:MAG: VWA domain-containing protein [Pyrinomonadaceae bacterium]|nr:VWA domain-containing protein [Pyrinomonadaceae bacterium]